MPTASHSSRVPSMRARRTSAGQGRARRLEPASRPSKGMARPVSFALRQRYRWDRRRLLTVLLMATMLATTGHSVQRSRSTVTGLGDTQTVAVANRDLPAGHRLAASDVQLKEYPTDHIAPETAAPDQVVGLVLRSPTFAGEVIHGTRLSPHRFGLSRDERALTLPVALAPAPVLPGDSVELVGLTGVGDGRFVDAHLVGPARIVDVSEGGVTVAMEGRLVIQILSYLATGAVEMIMTPLE